MCFNCILDANKAAENAKLKAFTGSLLKKYGLRDRDAGGKGGKGAKS